MSQLIFERIQLIPKLLLDLVRHLRHGFRHYNSQAAGMPAAPTQMLERRGCKLLNWNDLSRRFRDSRRLMA
jgi:hypothetical protein